MTNRICKYTTGLFLDHVTSLLDERMMIERENQATQAGKSNKNAYRYGMGIVSGGKRGTKKMKRKFNHEMCMFVEL